MNRDFYVVVGIGRTQAAWGIHGERTAIDDALRFRDVGEAYDTLADPHAVRSSWATSRDARRPPAPPLMAEPISLLRDFDAVGPTVEEMFDRFLQTFTHRHETKSHTVTPVQLELAVSPEQAARGGTLAIGVPAFFPCEHCGGTGRNDLYLCTGCGGRGIVAAEEAVHFHVPPRLRDGDIVEVSLDAAGIPDQVLRIGFRVGA